MGKLLYGLKYWGKPSLDPIIASCFKTHIESKFVKDPTVWGNISYINDMGKLFPYFKVLR